MDKPGDVAAQNLTWSEYKQANTAQYLIGCAPSGVTSNRSLFSFNRP